MEPLEVIKNILEETDELFFNNKQYNIRDIFLLYSADFASILLKYFPDATLMMNKNFKKCALLIQGGVYDASGIVFKGDYFVAQNEEIAYIQKSFPQISDYWMDKINEHLGMSEIQTNQGYVLRKNSNNTN